MASGPKALCTGQISVDQVLRASSSLVLNQSQTRRAEPQRVEVNPDVSVHHLSPFSSPLSSPLVPQDMKQMDFIANFFFGCRHEPPTHLHRQRDFLEDEQIGKMD